MNRSSTRKVSRRSVVAGLAVASAVQRSAQASQKDDVIVVGAGLSGLHAAWLLEDQGLNVTVLESRSWVGGRVRTLDHIPGKPEAGATSLGLGYARALDTAERLDLAMVKERPRTSPSRGTTLLHYFGQTIHSDAWEGSPINPYPPSLRHMMPYELTWGHLPKANPLQNLDDWLDSAFANYDIPVSDFLTSLGLNDAAQRTVEAPFGYSHRLRDMSALNLFHVWSSLNLAPARDIQTSMAVRGGMQRLPEAMAAALHKPVLLKHIVRRITESKTGVVIECENGTIHNASAVILAVPATVLRTIDLDPPLSGLQAEGVSSLPYHPATLLFFSVREAFWERDGLPPNIWGDSAAGRFFGQRFDAEGRYAESNAFSTFVAYLTGPEAEYVDRLGQDAGSAYVLNALARIRPSTRGALTPLTTVSWQNDTASKGAYAYWAPGQVTRFARRLGQPRGNIFFAGEHLSTLTRGMEGAMESGERAAFDVLETLA